MQLINSKNKNKNKNSHVNQGRTNSIVDPVLSKVLAFISVSTGVLFFLIVLFLVSEAMPFFHSEHWQGLLGQEWYPLDNLFGMLPMILASFYVVVGMVVFGAPIGFLCAVGLARQSTSFYSKTFETVLKVFAGIPSVIFGFWGLTVIVPFIARWQPPGASLCAAVLILTLMVLPTMIITFSLALKAVPRHLTLGAKALGLSEVGLLYHVQIPSARLGLYNGLFLAMARALGETMAVVMVAGNVVQMPTGLFEPVRVLTANIALEMAYAMDVHRASLFTSGLLLTAVITVLSWLASRTNRIIRQTSC